MNRKMLEVMQRRGELLEKIAAQREQIAVAGMRWKTPLEVADKGLAVVHFMRSNPVLVAALTAAVVIRRRGTAALLSSGWRLWRLYRWGTSFSEKLTSYLYR